MGKMYVFEENVQTSQKWSNPPDPYDVGLSCQQKCVDRILIFFICTVFTTFSLEMIKNGTVPKRVFIVFVSPAWTLTLGLDPDPRPAP